MDNNQQFSPPIDNPSTMNFPMAIGQLTQGAKITRLEWHNTDYGFLSSEGWLAIFRNGEVFKHWTVNEGDLKATDWIIIK